MKSIAEFLSRDRVVFLTSTTKEAALNTLVDTIAAVEDTEKLRKAIFDREWILSTGIGLGIAVPHAKISSIKQFVVAVGVAHHGIEFNSLDGQPVKIVVMIAGPDRQHEQYLRILARTTLLLKSAMNRQAILGAKTEDDVYRLFTERSA
ncbi:MAG TPA: PTS sugar transporter subunit IIA [Planctomycetota bacterium]|nr:PTS sugar transporter subunit IIA [Planctomycetota bacterium]HUW34950.1 PTS sugar transporter subunit IIA [Planctomycetota bacterium]